jgi:hypothetical protein
MFDNDLIGFALFLFMVLYVIIFPPDSGTPLRDHTRQ